MNDFDVSIFVITDENECVLSSDYNRQDDGRGMFIVITNDVLNSDYDEDNSVCLYTRWMMQYVKRRVDFHYYSDYEIRKFYPIERIEDKWQYNNEHIPNIDVLSSTEDEDIIQYSNGYRQTNDIMTNVEPLIKKWNSLNKQFYIPAVMYAYDTTIRFNNKTYHGYLPQIGQMFYIFRNVEYVNELLKECLKERCGDYSVHYGEYLFPVSYLTYLLTDGYWSSTPSDDKFVWSISRHKPALMFSTKQHVKNVLPLFNIDWLNI